MKSIDQGASGPQWTNSLVGDIIFIKKHLRYPFSKKTVPSLLLLTTFVILMSRMLWFTFFISGKAPVYVWIALILLVTVCTCILLYQYFSLIRFKSIPTPFYANENRVLLDKFLKSQQLATYTHPALPEVLQIVSRPLGNSKSETREVMIFIADDKRILINSHFVNQKYSLTPPSSNAGKMAGRLREWLKMTSPGFSEGTEVRQV